MITKTFDELGKGYAEQVSKAIASDRFSGSITASDLKGSTTLAVLKEIESNLDTWNVKDQPLTKEQRKQILTIAGKELELPVPEQFAQFTKAASNDAYMELVNYINNIVKPGK